MGDPLTRNVATININTGAMDDYNTNIIQEQIYKIYSKKNNNNLYTYKCIISLNDYNQYVKPGQYVPNIDNARIFGIYDVYIPDFISHDIFKNMFSNILVKNIHSIMEVNEKEILTECYFTFFTSFYNSYVSDLHSTDFTDKTYFVDENENDINEYVNKFSQAITDLTNDGYIELYNEINNEQQKPIGGKKTRRNRRNKKNKNIKKIKTRKIKTRKV